MLHMYNDKESCREVHYGRLCCTGFISQSRVQVRLHFMHSFPNHCADDAYLTTLVPTSVLFKLSQILKVMETT